MPAKKILTTYLGNEYNKTDYAYRATMEFYYAREGLLRTDNKLRTYQNLFENEPYTPYLDTFNVTGLLDWYYHPRMINESFEVNADGHKGFDTGTQGVEIINYGSAQIVFPDPDPEIFNLELYKDHTKAFTSIYAENRLSARTLEPKHFAYYYKHFDRLDREYGKIFDLKTGRMYPEAKEKFWPDAIDNIGITKPDYVNPRLKPENWRIEEEIWGRRGHNLRMYHQVCRDIKLDEFFLNLYGYDLCKTMS